MRDKAQKYAIHELAQKYAIRDSDHKYTIRDAGHKYAIRAAQKYVIREALIKYVLRASARKFAIRDMTLKDVKRRSGNTYYRNDGQNYYALSDAGQKSKKEFAQNTQCVKRSKNRKIRNTSRSYHNTQYVARLYNTRADFFSSRIM